MKVYLLYGFTAWPCHLFINNSGHMMCFIVRQSVFYWIIMRMRGGSGHYHVGKMCDLTMNGGESLIILFTHVS